MNPALAGCAGGVHRAGTALKNFLYDRNLRRPRRLARPVISIGNLALGGTGKTPLCLFLYRELTRRGRRPAILLRGYSTGRISDEKLLYERKADPHALFIGADRYACGQRAETLGYDTHLLDDGFQHRQLHRDCNILLVDASDPWARQSSWMREGRSSMRRATIIVITRLRPGDALASELAGVHDYGIPLFRAWFEPALRLNGRKVLAFCAIGNPESFRRTIGEAGGEVVDLRVFRDHHEFRPEEIDGLRRRADRLGAELLLTTEKDIVRLSPDAIQAARIDALPIETRVEAGLVPEVLRQIGSRP